MTTILAYVALLAEKDGMTPLNEKVAHTWTRDLPDGWRVTLNPSNEMRITEGIDIPPFTAFVEFNGFPAGFVNPHGGDMAAGEYANEDALIAILKAEIGDHPLLEATP